MKTFSIDDTLDWVDQLSDHDYVVFDRFMSDRQYQALRTFFMKKLGQNAFDKAGIGTFSTHHIDKEVRGDYVYWLSPEEDQSIAFYFEGINLIIQTLKRYCFLPISGSEFHLAHYPRGTFYEKHIDQFKGRGNRLMSVIFYLNDDWTAEEGGALKLYLAEREEVIAPVGNRLVLFKSDIVPHEVMTTHVNRYSITGWLLNQPEGLGFLLG